MAQLEHRQSSFTVEVKNLSGAALPGAVVRVEMINPTFRFGTAIVYGELYAGQAEYSLKGLEALQSYFNSVTFGNYMKWTYVEGRQGAATLATISDVFALRPFGSDDAMRLRGHVTVWGASYQLPADLKAMTDAAAVKARIRTHVTDYHTLFKGAGIDQFDLYNEHFHERAEIIAKAVPGGGTVAEAAEVAEWFKAAKLADPAAKLFINEYNILNFWNENDADVIAYKTLVDAVRDAGGPIDGIGLQAHMDRMITKAQLKRRFDILAAPMAPTSKHPNGLPGVRLEVTELDINSNAWSATPAEQAELTANVLEASFEHSSVDGVTIWGMRDSIHWRKNAVLFDDSNTSNWVVKPSGQVWIDRVKGTWWTHLAGVSDGAGQYHGTVFKGKHRVTVTYQGKTQEFVRDLTADETLRVEFDSAPIDTSGSFLANLSVRAPLATGQVLTLGFVVDGGSKSLLVRAAGPALAAYLPVVVGDPALEISRAGEFVVGNDNWDAATVQATANALGAFGFAAGSEDAALITLIDGPHTAQITGTGAGVVLGEIYDTAGAATGPRLVNLSARHFTGPGADVLTAGFSIVGRGKSRLLIRGVGPSLDRYGVSETLTNPKITLFSGETAIAENDDWDPSLADTMAALGAFALDSLSADAAMLVVLNAGKSYTVQVSGADGGMGTALIEVYEVRW